jgi:hypothetical protein
MAFNFSPRVVTNGLVLYLDAGNTRSYPTTGLSWNDLTINQYNGALTNGPTFNSSRLGSIVFDGIDDYVNYGTAGEQLFRTATTVTMSFACFCTGFSNPSGGFSWAPLVAIDRYQLGNGYRKLAFYLGRNGVIESVYCEFFNGLGGTTSVINSRTILNTFNVFTATVNSTNARLYVNGVMVDEKAGITLNSNPLTSDFTVGARINTGYNGWFKGNMFNVMFYNRALTATEVLQNYNAIKSRLSLL